MENIGRDDLRKLVRRLIDKFTFHEDWFEVVFRSGVMVAVGS